MIEPQCDTCITRVICVNAMKSYIVNYLNSKYGRAYLTSLGMNESIIMTAYNSTIRVRCSIMRDVITLILIKASPYVMEEVMNHQSIIEKSKTASDYISNKLLNGESTYIIFRDNKHLIDNRTEMERIHYGYKV